METRSPKSKIRNPQLYRLGFLAILLLALGLRLYRLTGQSLWNDEGTSVALAGRDLLTIARSAALDIHPPLYYWLLHFWTLLFGDAEAAVRILSVFAGVALVAISGRLADCLLGPRPALLVALLSALSPFQIVYSQEVRMYIWATLWGTLAVLCLVEMEAELASRSVPASDRKPPLNRQTGLWAAGYVLSATAGLYTHYFVAPVLLAGNLGTLWGIWRHWWSGQTNRRFLTLWISSNLLVLFLFAPWFWLALGQQWTNWPALTEPYSLFTLLQRVVPLFALGPTAGPALPGGAGITMAAMVVFVILALVGCWPVHWRGRPHPKSHTKTRRPRDFLGVFVPLCEFLGTLGRGGEDRPHPPAPSPTGRGGEDRPHPPAHSPAGRGGEVLPVLFALLPILVLYLLALRRPFYHPKFLLVATPGIYLLVVNGLDQIIRLAGRRSSPAVGVFPVSPARLLAFLLTLALLLPPLPALANYYFDPRYARDDYRGIVQTITHNSRPGDAIVINAPGQVETVQYYYKGSLPLYPLPRQRPLNEPQTLIELQQIVQQVGAGGQIWAILWATNESDPKRLIEGWLDEHAYKASDRWYGNVRLVRYAVPPAQPPDQPQVRQEAQFGPAIRFLGYTLPPVTPRAGDILPLTLYWQATAPISERYTVFTHILTDVHLWGQRDSEPGGGARLTTTWQPGETIIDNYGIPVLPGTPPGDYWIEIGLYRPETGARLPVRDVAGQLIGDRLLLGPIRISRPAQPPASTGSALDTLDIGQRLAGRFGDTLALLGYSLEWVGPATSPAIVARLTLFWQALRPPDRDLSAILTLADANDRPLMQQTHTPGIVSHPTSRWLAGEIVRDPYLIVLTDPPPGPYRLRLAVVDSATGQTLAPAGLGVIGPEGSVLLLTSPLRSGQ